MFLRMANIHTVLKYNNMEYFIISKDDLHAVTKACEGYGVNILKTEMVAEDSMRVYTDCVSMTIAFSIGKLTQIYSR